MLAPVDPRFVDPKDPKLLVSLTSRAHSGQSPGKCESLSLGIHLDSPEDLDNAMKELTEKGVVFTGVVSEGLEVYAFFVGPDKNPLYLHAIRSLSA